MLSGTQQSNFKIPTAPIVAAMLMSTVPSLNFLLIDKPSSFKVSRQVVIYLFDDFISAIWIHG